MEKGKLYFLFRWSLRKGRAKKVEKRGEQTTVIPFFYAHGGIDFIDYYYPRKRKKERGNKKNEYNKRKSIADEGQGFEDSFAVDR